MTSSASVPVRTCVGCRARDPRSSLVRLVVDRTAAAPAVIVDPHTSAPGRGAWVHPQPHCLDHAITRRALARALRVPTTVGYAAVVEWFDQNTTHERWSSNKRAGQKPMGTR
ncbi:YlxR family protein [Ruania zhangjianzhongii]|uniref:YlxR family protein n=1 Tax=Ruania zhangjianzhongii TaxID=2603206 RepID=UPI0011C7D89E|nr:YlxR family protein [Ruania zhangjianzhongii]